MSGMWTYFARRLLLVPITFLVITFMVYAVLRVTPGGPIEQLENQANLAEGPTMEMNQKLQMI